MPEPRDLDSSESALAFFGSELRRLRDLAGLSQTDLGRVMFCARSLVGMIETADRMPSRQFAESADKALGTDGCLTRLWPLVNRTAYPSWFREYVDLEESATVIRSFEPQVVDGLLQTEDYARAVIGAVRPDDLSERVAARLERQRILWREKPPLLWLVMDEAVLLRPIGGPEVMHAQIRALLDAVTRPRIVLQILPLAVGVHSLLKGPVTIMSFADGPNIAYAESDGGGELIGTVEDVHQCEVRYDLARAAALSPAASLDMLATLLEEPNPWETRYRR